MDKLELKHIAPYLPYGLKFINTIDNSKEELSGLEYYVADNYKNPQFKDKTPIVFSNIDYSSCWELKEIKPILRPLSDLTKETEHDGEKFVPIEEIAKIGYKRYWENTIKVVSNKCFLNPKGYNHYIFKYNEKEMSFYCWRDNEISGDCSVPKQLEMFQRLFEYHFDVYGLIEKDLAIDFNKLKI